MAIFRRRLFGRRKKTDPLAVEIARLAQGTPIVGYHDEDGHLVIPKEYDDDYLKDRSSNNPARYPTALLASSITEPKFTYFSYGSSWL